MPAGRPKRYDYVKADRSSTLSAIAEGARADTH